MMKPKKCPNCRSEGLDLFLGFTTGNYLCKRCGYIGPIAVEENTIITRKKKTKKRHKK